MLPDITTRRDAALIENGHNTSSCADAWDGLWKDIAEVYGDNPYLLPQLQEWHERERQRTDLRLERATITNQNTGYAIEAYIFNGQVLLSKKDAIFTVPFPRSTKDNPNAIFKDQLLVGWLNDFCYDEGFFDTCKILAKEAIENAPANVEAAITSLERELGPYPGKVLEAIQRLRTDPSLPGGKANVFPNALLRLLGKNEDGKVFRAHRDNGPVQTKAHAYARHILLPFVGPRTVYGLDGNNIYEDTAPFPVPFSMPPGVMYSHCIIGRASPEDALPIEGLSKWGIRHFAPSAPDGRAAFVTGLNGMWEPLRDEPSPWEIKIHPVPDRKPPHGVGPAKIERLELG